MTLRHWRYARVGRRRARGEEHTQDGGDGEGDAHMAAEDSRGRGVADDGALGAEVGLMKGANFFAFLPLELFEVCAEAHVISLSLKRVGAA